MIRRTKNSQATLCTHVGRWLAATLIAVTVAGGCGQSDSGLRAGRSTGNSSIGNSSDSSNSSSTANSGTGSGASTPPAAAGDVTIAERLTITDDSSAAATATAAISAVDGGSIAVTATDGTEFELIVPPDSLVADTTITATASSSVEGIDGTTANYGVRLEPEGLQFIGAASLRVRPSTAIADGHALAFSAADDGSSPDIGVLDDDPATNGGDLAILVPHFSEWGISALIDAIDKIRVTHAAANAEQQLFTEIAQSVEIRRTYLREGRPTAEIDLVLQNLFIEHIDKVVIPLLEKTGPGCDDQLGVATATSNYYYLWLHNSLPAGITSLKPLAEKAFLTMEQVCEKERIAECIASGDPGVLVSFWKNMNSWRGRFNYAAKPGDEPALYEIKAKKKCKPYAYFITGGLQDFQVSGILICDVREPFTLAAPGVATLEFSGGDSLSGTYSATGAFNLSYAGTYTISLSNGPGEAGTMIGTSSGQTAGEAGSGAETYTLTPGGEVC